MENENGRRGPTNIHQVVDPGTSSWLHSLVEQSRNMGRKPKIEQSEQQAAVQPEALPVFGPHLSELGSEIVEGIFQHNLDAEGREGLFATEPKESAFDEPEGENSEKIHFGEFSAPRRVFPKSSFGFGSVEPRRER